VKSLNEIKQRDIKKIRQTIKKEFPNDPALQQINIARKIIAKEAELENMSFLEYVRLQMKKEQQSSKQ
jgi:hypothetical protein